ncbi:amidohydrolase family protein [Paraliomyxa miuraensis]|uniref:amidohydrolase family protein n=1 Tax=Paraliomyxa miuraensis TaxID=376150 RepID=UPI00225A88F4|nr:amidohydrolase family protein [Paraliomyxa miuraensis]MCX4241429.1 amidohydrolase family protein [Paraliomyxa miuraensis]
MLVRARIPGSGSVALEIRDGLLVGIHDEPPAVASVIDLEGRFVVPGAVDSHVHLAHRFGADGVERGRARLAAAGVVAGVDLAAPLAAMRAFDRERWLTAGPMLTARRGYPTRSWGSQGFGLEIDDGVDARAAVDVLVDAGASVVKIPLGQGPTLRRSVLHELVEHAHARGLKVAAHALGDADVALAADVGVDVLAHAPVEPLTDDTVAAWRGRAVVSTLMAFGARPTAVDNLRRLHEAGATVLYGTDLGNSPVVGIDPEELEELARAGLSSAEILDAMTEIPATFWGLPGLGRLEPGKAASLLVLDEDPLRDPTTLARPVAVYVDGVRLESS